MGAFRTLAAGAALLALAGCDGARTSSAGGGGNSLCTPFATAQAATPASPPTSVGAPPTAAPIADPGAGLDDCLHRWAYALAASSDGADHVARAALAACGPALARWNQQTASSTGDGGPPIQAPSLITGELTSPLGEHLNFAQGRALLYVVQARAGKCAAPPMANGVPAGLTRD
ncbi:MAG TPA: hypothetical protein VGC92_05745 [Phenylobacterium sp.]|jgi:hypothetical protein